MEFYERVSGARMHAAYVRPGGVAMVTILFIHYLQLIETYTHYVCWSLVIADYKDGISNAAAVHK